MPRSGRCSSYTLTTLHIRCDHRAWISCRASTCLQRQPWLAGTSRPPQHPALPLRGSRARAGRATNQPTSRSLRCARNDSPTHARDPSRARFELRCGAGIAAVAAIDEVDMPALARGDEAGHHRMVRDLPAVAQLASLRARLEPRARLAHQARERTRARRGDDPPNGAWTARPTSAPFRSAPGAKRPAGSCRSAA
jgi:hypothetical protein